MHGTRKRHCQLEVCDHRRPASGFAQCQKNPSHGQYWPPHQHCRRLREGIDFLDLTYADMHPDVHLLTNDYVNRLEELREHIYWSASEADPDLNSDHMIFFGLALKRRLRLLPTTLCDNTVCPECLALPRPNNGSAPA